MWVGPAAVLPGPSLIECEVAISREAASVVVHAPPGLPVDERPLFDGTSCAVPTTPCADDGAVCGNLCEIPEAGTCAAVAAQLLMQLSRFAALNAGISCSAVIPAGDTVCMGGTCGD